MKITAQSLTEAMISVVPEEEHGDYVLTLDEMDDETRKQIEGIAAFLTERFTAPLEVLVRDQQAWIDDIILPLGNPLDAPDPRGLKRVEFRARASKLLGEEAK